MIMLAMGVTWDIIFLSVTVEGQCIALCLDFTGGYKGNSLDYVGWSTKKIWFGESRKTSGRNGSMSPVGIGYKQIGISLLTTCSLRSSKQILEEGGSQQDDWVSWVPCVWLRWVLQLQ